VPAEQQLDRAVYEELPQLRRLEEWAEASISHVDEGEQTMRIVLDRSKCTSLGICETIAPEYFEVDEDGELAVLREEVSPDQRALLEEAVAGCPTAALRLQAVER
jgi:ferredoxin